MQRCLFRLFLRFVFFPLLFRWITIVLNVMCLLDSEIWICIHKRIQFLFFFFYSSFRWFEVFFFLALLFYIWWSAYDMHIYDAPLYEWHGMYTHTHKTDWICDRHMAVWKKKPYSVAYSTLFMYNWGTEWEIEREKEKEEKQNKPESCVMRNQREWNKARLHKLNRMWKCRQWAKEKGTKFPVVS